MQINKPYYNASVLRTTGNGAPLLPQRWSPSNISNPVRVSFKLCLFDPSGMLNLVIFSREQFKNYFESLTKI